MDTHLCETKHNVETLSEPALMKHRSLAVNYRVPLRVWKHAVKHFHDFLELCSVVQYEFLVRAGFGERNA